MKKKRSKSVVLLSAGLDSSVNLAAAHKQGEVLLALTFDYGQRARVREIKCAEAQSRAFGIPHKVIALPFFAELGHSSLTDTSKKVPRGKEVRIDNLKTSQKTAKSVWVPNRNGIFLNIAAGIAEAMGADFVIPGFNAEEAVTFADNSPGYMKALDKSFEFSTQNRVKTLCYTVKMNKTQIAKLGKKLEVDFSLIWPCYHGGENWCRECESCQRSLRALREAGIDEV
jgi:7-cyano-7-deazaguanine synthase